MRIFYLLFFAGISSAITETRLESLHWERSASAEATVSIPECSVSHENHVSFLDHDFANTRIIVSLPRDSRPRILRLSHEYHMYLHIVRADCGTRILRICSLQHHWLSATREIYCRELWGHKWQKSSSGNIQPRLRVSTFGNNIHHYSFILSNQTRCWARSRWLHRCCGLLDIYGWCRHWD